MKLNWLKLDRDTIATNIPNGVLVARRAAFDHNYGSVCFVPGLEVKTLGPENGELVERNRDYQDA